MNGTATPWTNLYPPHVDPIIEHHPRRSATLAEAWSHRVTEEPDQLALRYFDYVFDVARTDELTDALAASFSERGVNRGDHVGIQLQNIPQFALCMLALWKLGAVPLILNTMYGARELANIFNDAQPVGLVSSEISSSDIAQLDLNDTSLWVLYTDDDDLAAVNYTSTYDVPELADSADPGLIRGLLPYLGSAPAPVELSGNDAALLTYTSGTTGPPKGAIGTHSNLLAVGYGVQQWLDLQPGDGVLAVAPIFHITGAVATAATALTVGRSVLVLVGRIRPDSMLTALRHDDVQHILGSITVYNALLDSDDATCEDFAGLKTVYSGGAPVPPATVEKFEQRFGHYIHNVYGMTETASAVIAVPLGQRAPMDSASGTLAIGVPLPGMYARVFDHDDHDVELGAMGELVLKGPQCTSEYLNRPAATADTIRDGWLHTGDVAVMDGEGWIYLVDRQKDQINVSGYKVWPREVEDVIYEYPAVKEAAVVALPDEYSGERVVAFVSLKSGSEVAPDEIRNHVKERIANFKVPKDVVVRDELPKTPTGKIQRRVLREENISASSGA